MFKGILAEDARQNGLRHDGGERAIDTSDKSHPHTRTSVPQGILAEDTKVYATTAANEKESSMARTATRRCRKWN